jgi:hypothetical protein
MNKNFALYVASLLEEQAELLKKQIDGLKAFADDEGDELEQKKEKIKKPTDPNRPKSTSGYLLFMKDYSKKLKEDIDFVNKTQTEKFTILAKMWKDLDADSVIKKDYLQQADQLRKEYFIKLKEYDPNYKPKKSSKEIGTTSVLKTIDNNNANHIEDMTQEIDITDIPELELTQATGTTSNTNNNSNNNKNSNDEKKINNNIINNNNDDEKNNSSSESKKKKKKKHKREHKEHRSEDDKKDTEKIKKEEESSKKVSH